MIRKRKNFSSFLFDYEFYFFIDFSISFSFTCREMFHVIKVHIYPSNARSHNQIFFSMRLKCKRIFACVATKKPSSNFSPYQFYLISILFNFTVLNKGINNNCGILCCFCVKIFQKEQKKSNYVEFE